MKKLLYYQLPAILWAAFIFYLSGIPGLKIVESWWDVILRNGAHIFVFGILSILTFRALNQSRMKSVAFHTTAVITFIYAVTDEIHQHFVPTRQFDVWDIGFDALGILIGLIIIKRWKKSGQ